MEDEEWSDGYDTGRSDAVSEITALKERLDKAELGSYNKSQKYPLIIKQHE